MAQRGEAGDPVPAEPGRERCCDGERVSPPPFYAADGPVPLWQVGPNDRVMASELLSDTETVRCVRAMVGPYAPTWPVSCSPMKPHLGHLQLVRNHVSDFFMFCLARSPSIFLCFTSILCRALCFDQDL